MPTVRYYCKRYGVFKNNFKTPSLDAFKTTTTVATKTTIKGEATTTFFCLQFLIGQW
jgi:hypothetical protein